MPPEFVIDASVAVKWFTKENNTPEALLVFRQMHEAKVLAFAPSIIVYEIGNVLWKGKKEDIARIIRSLQELFISPLQIVELSPDLAEKSAEIMFKYDLSFYDATYACLAQTLNLPLFTANAKHHGRVKEIKILELK